MISRFMSWSDGAIYSDTVVFIAQAIIYLHVCRSDIHPQQVGGIRCGASLRIERKHGCPRVVSDNKSVHNVEEHLRVRSVSDGLHTKTMAAIWERIHGVD